MTLYKCLSDSIDFITNNLGPHFLGILNTKDFYHIFCIDNNYYKIKWYDNFIYFNNKNDLMRYVLSITNIITIVKFNYDKKHIIYYDRSKIILRCYRKYKLRTARIKNDLVIRGLTEYFFHPSKLSFEI